LLKYKSAKFWTTFLQLGVSKYLNSSLNDFSYVVLQYVLYSGTDNPLHEEYGGYDNVTVARDLGLPDLELLRFIHNNITPGQFQYSELRFLS